VHTGYWCERWKGRENYKDLDRGDSTDLIHPVHDMDQCSAPVNALRIFEYPESKGFFENLEIKKSGDNGTTLSLQYGFLASVGTSVSSGSDSPSAFTAFTRNWYSFPSFSPETCNKQINIQQVSLKTVSYLNTNIIGSQR
jgi:hypothetical protein